MNIVETGPMVLNEFVDCLSFINCTLLSSSESQNQEKNISKNVPDMTVCRLERNNCSHLQSIQNLKLSGWILLTKLHLKRCSEQTYFASFWILLSTFWWIWTLLQTRKLFKTLIVLFMSQVRWTEVHCSEAVYFLSDFKQKM